MAKKDEDYVDCIYVMGKDGVVHEESAVRHFPVEEKKTHWWNHLRRKKS